MFTRIVFNDFTAFRELDMEFSRGINIFIGENATGKTHIMKTLYASADITTSKVEHSFAEKINRVFLPSGDNIGRLVHRRKGRKGGKVAIYRTCQSLQAELTLSVSNLMTKPEKAVIGGSQGKWSKHPIESVYIPVKEMLSNAPGFKSEYETKKLFYEEIYPDIITRALKPILRGPSDKQRKHLMSILKRSIDGTVFTKGEEFFLKCKQGNLEFTLLAEGLRKLGLLWILINNGSLSQGSVLFWDEPETNLNPKLLKSVVEVLIELQRMGVQIFLATHNYVVLKEFDLQLGRHDQILFHSLYREKETKNIKVFTTDKYNKIEHNMIMQAFTDIYDRDVERAMKPE